VSTSAVPWAAAWKARVPALFRASIPARIRARLAAWYLFSLTLIVGIYAVTVLVLMHRGLASQVDRMLHVEIKAAAAAVQRKHEQHGPQWWMQPGTSLLKIDGDGHAEVWSEVSGGTVSRLAATLGAPQLPVLDHGSSAAKREKVADADGVSYYASTEARKIGDRLYAFRVTLPTAPVMRTLAELAMILLVGFVAVLTVGLLGGSAIAGLALAPISHIVAATRALRPTRLSDRLPETGPQDELRELTQVINGMIDRVQESFERERNFANDVAHELRTPLTAQIISAKLALTSRADNSNNAVETVQSMLEDAHHMHRLINGLLTLTRISTHGELPTLVSVDAAAAVAHCVNTLQVLAEEKGQSLVAMSDANTRIQADPTMLRQSLMNIVHNAIDHCGEGARIVVRLRAGARDDDKGHALILVEDDGPGIPPELQAQVFRRFFRGAGPNRSRGLGLGLAIAKAMTEAQGGTISLDAAHRRGTRFVLRFPTYVGLETDEDTVPPVRVKPGRPLRQTVPARAAAGLIGLSSLTLPRRRAHNPPTAPYSGSLREVLDGHSDFSH
jgi:two-component system, OmpR family, sensor kinase